MQVVMLCAACDRFASSVLEQNFTDWNIAEDAIRFMLKFTHGDGNALKVANSEIGKCEFCQRFRDQLALAAPDTPRSYRTLGYKTLIRTDVRREDKHRVRSRFTLQSLDRADLAFEVFQIPIAGPCAILRRQTPSNLLCQSADRPDSPQCIDLIKHWLQECEEIHAACSRTRLAPLPARLIDVGVTAGGCDGTPRLVLTNSGDCGRYVTLSYCWGTTTSSCRFITTTENIDLHRDGIPLHLLPKTLRDAVRITRLLGFRYLWVDALCIIQDDPQDWERQAANMSSIYLNAVVSIAAADATDSAAGFLHSRDRSGNETTVAQTSTGAEVGMTLSPAGRQQWETILSSALESRAWSLQERVLAPAVIHFGQDQSFWECCSGLASETCPVMDCSPRWSPHVEGEDYRDFVYELKLMVRRQRYTPLALLTWYEAVQRYSQRKLTIRSDRLPAIQGLADRMDPSTFGRYLYGLWSKGLHLGLLWRIPLEDKNRFTVQCEPRAPSWSWASHSASIEFHPVPSYDTGDQRPASEQLRPVANIELLDGIREQPSSLSPNLDLTQYLWIEGKCLRGICKRSHILPTDVYFESPGAHLLCHFDWIDLGDPDRVHVPAVEYVCVLIAVQQDIDSSAHEAFLLVEEVPGVVYDGGHKLYRRVGAGCHEYWPDWGESSSFTRAFDGRFLLT